MKVVHICTIDAGGAYQAVKRFTECMELLGIENEILVRTKIKEDSKCHEALDNSINRMISKGKNAINLLFSTKSIGSDVLGTDVSKNELVRNADIIFLHWVNSFLSCKSVEKLFRLNKPIIWVMHDAWLYTGGCHCNQFCNKFMEQCGKCPLIPSNKYNDITRKNFLRKKRMMCRGRIYLTAPSKKMCEEAKKSQILEGKQVFYLPNTVNLDIFKYLEDKLRIRHQYGIDCSKKIILFGAADNGIENPLKGFDFLQKAIEKLPPQEYMVVIFGKSNHDLLKDSKIEFKELGYIYDEKKLAQIYNMADVFVSPSSQESFGFTICEAMACGVPVVAFPTNGALDQIEHKVSGYIAQLYNVEDLAEGIKFCIENSERLGNNARKHVVENYSYEKVGNMISQLCEKLLVMKDAERQM